MKVLVVDDDLTILEALKTAMEFNDYQVEAISHGEKTVQLAQKLKPDIILLDFLLSGIDGCEITKSLRSHPDTKNIPVIMLSAHPEAKKIANKIGINTFLSKPFELDELFQKIKILTS